MKKNKDLVKQLRKYNIPFEFVDGIYYLFNCGLEFPYTEKEAWSVVNSHRYSDSPMKENLKRFSNKKERTRLRENLVKDRFENAEVRDNIENHWNWD
jgi:hypothetical protein